MSSPPDEFEFPSHWLQPVETICAGDYIRDPTSGIPVRVHSVLTQTTGGMWPTTQYMGLVSDAAQLVRTAAGTWTFISRVGVQRAEQCDSIHALVLDSAKTVTVDGSSVARMHHTTSTEDIATRECSSFSR